MKAKSLQHEIVNKKKNGYNYITQFKDVIFKSVCNDNLDHFKIKEEAVNEFDFQGFQAVKTDNAELFDFENIYLNDQLCDPSNMPMSIKKEILDELNYNEIHIKNYNEIRIKSEDEDEIPLSIEESDFKSELISNEDEFIDVNSSEENSVEGDLLDDNFVDIDSYEDNLVDIDSLCDENRIDGISEVGDFTFDEGECNNLENNLHISKNSKSGQNFNKIHRKVIKAKNTRAKKSRSEQVRRDRIRFLSLRLHQICLGNGESYNKLPPFRSILIEAEDLINSLHRKSEWLDKLKDSQSRRRSNLWKVMNNLVKSAPPSQREEVMQNVQSISDAIANTNKS